MKRKFQLVAQISPFTTFCEGSKNIEKDFSRFYRFYYKNYLHHLPVNKTGRVLVTGSGHGYFINLLKRQGYQHVVGIDSDRLKVSSAKKRGFPTIYGNCFEYLASRKNTYDLIITEQELNHLTRDEILTYFHLCRQAIKKGGLLLVHAINSANPLTAPDAVGQNFDHYTFFTENSLEQVFCFTGFEKIKVFPLNYYVFPLHPLNYPAKYTAGLFHVFFRLVFSLYGKPDRIFTKKLAAIGFKP